MFWVWGELAGTAFARSSGKGGGGRVKCPNSVGAKWRNVFMPVSQGIKHVFLPGIVLSSFTPKVFRQEPAPCQPLDRAGSARRDHSSHEGFPFFQHGGVTFLVDQIICGFPLSFLFNTSNKWVPATWKCAGGLPQKYSPPNFRQLP